MLIKKHKKTLQCILGSSLLCSCLCLYTLSFVDFHWTCNWMRWEPFNALFFPLYHQSWYYIFSKVKHWLLQSPSIASRAMNVFFKCTEISYLILFQTVSLFRFYCFPLDPSVCFLKYHSVAKATIAFWQQFHLYKNSRNVVLIVPVRLPHSYRWCWGRDCIIGLGTLMSRHNPLIGVTWFRCEGEGSGTQGRERKTLKKCPYRLLRSSLLCNHFSKMYLYAINDPEEYFIAQHFSPSVFFGYKIKWQQMRQLFD